MKPKLLLLSAAVLCATANVHAQDKDKNVFNHLSIGLDTGTPGWGLDVAMPVCDYMQVRVGFATFPKITVNTDLDVGAPSVPDYDIPSNIDIKGRTGFTNGKLLLDVYPFRKSGFHVTLGAYFGASEIAKANNKENGVLKELAAYNAANPSGQYGVELGDYLLTPDADGDFEARIKTASFKPYAGIGFGRAVPKKRVGFMVELGCQFWGSPKLYCNGTEIDENKTGDGDAGGVIKTLSKITVYPVVNFRICGRVF